MKHRLRSHAGVEILEASSSLFGFRACPIAPYALYTNHPPSNMSAVNVPDTGSKSGEFHSVLRNVVSPEEKAHVM